jgi:hypothetical protein
VSCLSGKGAVVVASVRMGGPDFFTYSPAESDRVRGDRGQMSHRARAPCVAGEPKNWDEVPFWSAGGCSIRGGEAGGASS